MVSGALSKIGKKINIKGANSGANSEESSRSESTATSPVPSEKSSVYDFDSAAAEDSASFKKYKSPEKQSPQLLKKPVKRLSKDAVTPKMEPTEDADETPATRLSTKPKVRLITSVNNSSIPVGCVPSAAVAVSGGGVSAWGGEYLFGGCLPRGCTPSLPCGQNF